jgi:hypothetical protein
MKVLIKVETPGTEEVLEALGKVLDDTPALEKAKRLLLQQEEVEQGS